MNWKKKLLKNLRLYVVIDKAAIKNNPASIVAAKIKTVPCVIQLRDKGSNKKDILKEALKLKKILSKTKTIFIINDYLDIAKIACCDGIHLGQDDASIEVARKVLGKNKIIGISCHNIKQAKEAQTKGADYIGIGPIFATPTKPEYKAIGLGILEKIKKEIKIPAFAIGGINKSNIKQIIGKGISRAAMVRQICRAQDIKKSALYFNRLLNN